jgi:4-alpha-glucanotransferase
VSGVDQALANLAQRVGIAVEWIDASDRPQRVSPDVLRRILPALGVACANDREITESTQHLGHAQAPSMITCDVGEGFSASLPYTSHARIAFEDGSREDIKPHTMDGGRLGFPSIERTGYHQLEIGDTRIPLAVAPKRCFSLDDAAKGDRLWGLAVQLYGLRRGGDMGIGDTRALATLTRHAARLGADALALSPTHALFSGNLEKYSPYAPSSRLFLNPLFADPAMIFGSERVSALLHEAGSDNPRSASDALIDWPEAAARKFYFFRRLFDSFHPTIEADPEDGLVRAFRAFRRAGGDLLENHARFETIYAERGRRDPAQADWRRWPNELRDPKGSAVTAFAAAHAREITFHIFLQWIADRSFAAVQKTAKDSHMRIGLIADLAVGMEAGGSQAWSRQDESLVGLTVGAPPDFFNPKGQSWGLTTYSPLALQAKAFAPFIAILRAALRNAGGVRIDHALGLKRLWLVPNGAAPSEGAYLAYPFDDLLRLIKLESQRHQAVVIGEDLGTVPEGFRDILDDAAIAGTDVLWFAREKNRFLPPDAWRSNAIAMTSTHDLPTLSGWWKGCDIKIREDGKLFGPGEDSQSLQKARSQERSSLWNALQSAGATKAAEPRPEEAAPAVNAAIAFVSESPSPLLLLPLEDMLGLDEQPNLPGTIDEHPNWRRRYPQDTATILDAPSVAARIGSLSRGKKA